MIISGMQKLTLLDYPNKTACLLFTQGCNFRCPFCHNKSLLENSSNNEIISEEEVFNYSLIIENVLPKYKEIFFNYFPAILASFSYFA